MRVVIFQFSFVIADSHIFNLMLLAEVSISCFLLMQLFAAAKIVLLGVGIKNVCLQTFLNCGMEQKIA